MTTTMTEYCKHDMVLTQCTMCKPRPKVPEQQTASWGPWVPAKFFGDCTNCGDRIVPGQQIRGNGRRGGWLCTTCGQP